MIDLEDINERIVNCTRCPRLVLYRSEVSEWKRRMYKQAEYWGRPVPGFGDPNARVLIVGLAPAAHGANRTGRMFTGDRCGEWLYGALYKFGFANIPESQFLGDALRLKDVYITSAVRCAPPDNRPLPVELAACRSYLIEEISWFKHIKAVVVLGKIAFEAYLSACRVAGISLNHLKPKFSHGSMLRLPNGVSLICSNHPSQRNTQTGRLTRDMFDSVFCSLRETISSV